MNERLKTEYTNELICPYCGNEYYDEFTNLEDLEDEDEIQCNFCNNEYEYVKHVTIKYSSYKIKENDTK